MLYLLRTGPTTFNRKSKETGKRQRFFVLFCFSFSDMSVYLLLQNSGTGCSDSMLPSESSTSICFWGLLVFESQSSLHGYKKALVL